MYFLALAADYDGTIAEHGVVGAQTVEALYQVKKSGRKVILVTGRDLPDLLRVFPQIEFSIGSSPRMELSCSIQQRKKRRRLERPLRPIL